MKSKFLLSIVTVILLSSCSTAYKSGQTPDDVYYSPAREISYEERRDDKVKEDNFYTDDQYLRMKVRNCNRWRMIDDFDYWYDSRYSFSNCYTNPYSNSGWYSHYYNSWNTSYYYSNCNCSCGNSYSLWYNNGHYWGNWNTPFYVAYYKNPKYYNGSTSGSFVKAYHNNSYNNSNSIYNPKTGTSSSNNGFGNLVKRVFSSGSSSSGSSNGGSWDRPVRTVSGGTSTTISSAGGSSGGYNSTGSSSSSGRGGRN